VSTETNTKRRDGDPVRVYADGRLWYWTGGRPGVGERIPERCGTLAAAEARAVELRARLVRTQGLGPQAASVLGQAMQDMIASMRTAGDAEGSIRQYKSNWNRWMPAEIAWNVRCLDVDIHHWAAIFDHANAEGASEPTVRNIARTLGVLMEWAVDRGYFASSEPFGDPRRRRKIVKKARRRARIVKAEREERYLFAICPKVSDVEKYAAAFEEVYPGYGRRLVLLAFATGLRINELLALRHDAIDLETGEVQVDWQLDRYNAWPARRLPKGNKTRIAFLWSFYTDVAESLIEDSLALDEDDEHYGWLFPRHRSKTGWADQAGKLAGQARKACDWDWTFHWLRHAFATYSMASKKTGGFKLDPVSVQHWLGHARLSTTQDMYVERQSDDLKIARRRTDSAPGRLVPKE
jgi:integrase